MRFTRFKIENFRGIESLELDLTTIPQAQIYTLVGLNESGKTTILEAINNFAYKTDTLAPLDLPGYQIKEIHSLIPIAKRSNFNGSVVTEVDLDLDDNDRSKISSFLSKTLNFVLGTKITTLRIRQETTFKNSKHDLAASKTIWTLPLKGRKKKGKTDKPLVGADWHTAIGFIRTLIPTILYFPNFLFEFPDRIYLEDQPIDKEKHNFYKQVIQDILDSLNNGLSIDTHIISRLKSKEINDKKSLEGLLLEMGRNLTKTIFGAWNKIFHQTISDKEIVLNCEIDTNENVFLEFQLKDTDGYYLITERSLGFRWFFVFLLLTQYRRSRKASPSNVLFLFDEPASNLHPTAQKQLLESFKSIAANSGIIYTTHSHHLINPEWLETTFVVKNEGLNTGNEINDYSAKKSNIIAQKYREFVATHPSETNYYQPILDVLDFCPSKLELVPDVVMVEGKNDYYTLALISNLLDSKKSILNLMPGMSASCFDSLIRLYLAWGKNFLVLLDSDPEGRAQKKRYEDLFGNLVLNRIFTLKELIEGFEGKFLEDLLDESDRLLIQQVSYPNDLSYKKTHFNRAVQEALAGRKSITVQEKTLKNFSALFDSLHSKLFSVQSKEIAPLNSHP